MSELNRSLGFWTIVALTLTSLVGTGMFLGTAIGARYSGNGVLIAWAVLIVLGLYVAACFGELIALFPSAGGVYEFSKHAYGRFFSFLIGWVTWVMSNLTIVVLIAASLQYILPKGLDSLSQLAIGSGLIILFNFIAFVGVDTSAVVVMVFAVETIAVFAAVIIPGLFRVDYSYFVPFMVDPWFMVFVSAFFMLESLMGWESASFLAEETRDPARTIPKALMFTTFVSGLLGLGFAFVSLGILPANIMKGHPDAVVSVVSAAVGSNYAPIIINAIVIALFGSIIGGIVATPRLLLAMARDRVFISQLSSIHPLTKTPHKAIIFQTIVSIIFLVIAFGSYPLLLAMFVPLALLVYVATILAVPILRYKMPQARRDFKVVFPVIGPIVVSFIYAGVVAFWLSFVPEAVPVARLILSIVAFGIPIYFLMLTFYHPSAINTFLGTFSHFNLFLERFLLPHKVRRKMVDFISDLHEKHIFEYGAGVGTLTLHLAEAVGPRGRIYAADLNHRNISLLRKRLEHRKIGHVEVIHDEHLINRVHPSVRNVDMIFSVGSMSYMQDVKKVLREMRRLLPEGGRLCFVEYVNFFKVLPDKEWLADKEVLKRLFKDSGFSVKIEVDRGFLWDYLFIFAIKTDSDVPLI